MERHFIPFWMISASESKKNKFQNYLSKTESNLLTGTIKITCLKSEVGFGFSSFRCWWWKLSALQSDKDRMRDGRGGGGGEERRRRTLYRTFSQKFLIHGLKLCRSNPESFRQWRQCRVPRDSYGMESNLNSSHNIHIIQVVTLCPVDHSLLSHVASKCWFWRNIRWCVQWAVSRLNQSSVGPWHNAQILEQVASVLSDMATCTTHDAWLFLLNVIECPVVPFARACLPAHQRHFDAVISLDLPTSIFSPSVVSGCSRRASRGHAVRVSPPLSGASWCPLSCSKRMHHLNWNLMATIFLRCQFSADDSASGVSTSFLAAVFRLAFGFPGNWAYCVASCILLKVDFRVPLYGVMKHPGRCAPLAFPWCDASLGSFLVLDGGVRIRAVGRAWADTVGIHKVEAFVALLMQRLVTAWVLVQLLSTCDCSGAWQWTSIFATSFSWKLKLYDESKIHSWDNSTTTSTRNSASTPLTRFSHMSSSWHAFVFEMMEQSSMTDSCTSSISTCSVSTSHPRSMIFSFLLQRDPNLQSSTSLSLKSSDESNIMGLRLWKEQSGVSPECQNHKTNVGLSKELRWFTSNSFRAWHVHGNVIAYSKSSQTESFLLMWIIECAESLDSCSPFRFAWASFSGTKLCGRELCSRSFSAWLRYNFFLWLVVFRVSTKFLSKSVGFCVFLVSKNVLDSSKRSNFWFQLRNLPAALSKTIFWRSRWVLCTSDVAWRVCGETQTWKRSTLGLNRIFVQRRPSATRKKNVDNQSWHKVGDHSWTLFWRRNDWDHRVQIFHSWKRLAGWRNTQYEDNVKVFQKIVSWFLLLCHQVVLSDFTHLFEIVVDPLDVEQTVHANFSPLNVVDHGEDEDRQSDQSSYHYRDFLFLCICSVNWMCLSWPWIRDLHCVPSNVLRWSTASVSRRCVRWCATLFRNFNEETCRHLCYVATIGNPQDGRIKCG